MRQPLRLVATCGVGIEALLAEELEALCSQEAAETNPAERDTGESRVTTERGAVRFTGDWETVWRANWRLRTANRVLVELGTWAGHDGAALHAGARNLVRKPRSIGGLDIGRLLSPRRTLAVRATSSASRVTDVRWIALRVKDGLVDGQRDRHGARSSVDRDDPDVPLRLRLHRDQATLFLDTSGQPLDHRGYRGSTVDAPLRESLAAACVLASGWDGRGPVVDPMCGSGTLLIEAGWWALGWAPARLRERFAFERLPTYDQAAWRRIREETVPGFDRATPLELYGLDRSGQAVDATRRNADRAGLGDRLLAAKGDAFRTPPPVEEGADPYAPAEQGGLVLINPPYGERLAGRDDTMPRIGDMLKQLYPGYTAVVLAGDADLGKHIGLRPRRRLPVRNGPIEARILVFDLY